MCKVISLVLVLFQLSNLMAQNSETKGKLQNVLDRVADQKKVFGTSFAIKKDSLAWIGASGDLSIDSPYFIASTTKLFTSAIILQLKSEGKLSLDDKIDKYLETSLISGLHVYKGIEYSNTLTIRHLLSHTSGLPDYFQDKGESGKSLEDKIKNGNDQFWSFEDGIEMTKRMKPFFAPGTKGKAHYSDANYQLLGKIIEVISKKSFSENCEDRIIKPLQLPHTYLYKDINDKTPKSFYYKTNELFIPKAMCSFGSDGGVVSTSNDMLIFIEAFFSGRLFPKEYISELLVWNKIFFPLKSGVGIHLFKLPWIFNPTGALPYFIGHSGLSGALAFYSPNENLYIVGTVNQVAHPDISFKTMIKLSQVVMKREKK